jgi:hypothetical protein
LLLVSAACAGAIGWWSGVGAQPQLPSSFFGTASIDGKPAPNGTRVRGYIDGNDCTQGDAAGTALDGGVAEYVMHVVHESQKPGCGNETKTVTFTVDGRSAAQTAKWKVGPQELNLNVGSGAPVALPTATATTPGSPPATGTRSSASPGATRPTAPRGTPPTDDVTFITPKPPGGNGDQPPPAANDGGAPVGLFLLLGFLLLAAGGGGIGFAMSRRPRATPATGSTDGPPPEEPP